jgi:hypothetical protein
MVMMARREGLRHWVVRKVDAGGESGVGETREMELGRKRMSNWGAFVKEFWGGLSVFSFFDISCGWMDWWGGWG